MRQAEYVGTVLEDGHLSLPETVRAQLALAPAKTVRVTLRVVGRTDGGAAAGWACFREMGRGAEPGTLREASRKHDEYLYGKPRQWGVCSTM